MLAQGVQGKCLVFLDFSHILHIQYPGSYGARASLVQFSKEMILTFSLLLAGHWQTGLSFKSGACPPPSYLSSCGPVQIGISLSLERISED